MDNKDITIVTAYFDLHRDQWPKQLHGIPIPGYQFRPSSEYLKYFAFLAPIKNPMVICTTSDLVSPIMFAREACGNKDNTVILTAPGFRNGYEPLLEKMNKVMQTDGFIKFVNLPHHPEYWNADYVLVNMLKSVFVDTAIMGGHVKTDLAAWIDFGYCRDPNTLNKNKLWRYPFNPNKIHLFNLRPTDDRPIFDVVKTGDVYMSGPAIVAGVTKWPHLEHLVFAKMKSLVDAGLVDDDQTLLYMSYRQDPSEFELHPIDENKGWFQVFKTFNEEP